VTEVSRQVLEPYQLPTPMISWSLSQGKVVGVSSEPFVRIQCCG